MCGLRLFTALGVIGAILLDVGFVTAYQAVLSGDSVCGGSEAAPNKVSAAELCLAALDILGPGLDDALMDYGQWMVLASKAMPGYPPILALDISWNLKLDISICISSLDHTLGRRYID